MIFVSVMKLGKSLYHALNIITLNIKFYHNNYRLGRLYLKLHKGSEKFPPDRVEDFEPDLREHDDKEFHPKYVNFVH